MRINQWRQLGKRTSFWGGIGGAWGQIFVGERRVLIVEGRAVDLTFPYSFTEHKEEGDY